MLIHHKASVIGSSLLLSLECTLPRKQLAVLIFGPPPALFHHFWCMFLITRCWHPLHHSLIPPPALTFPIFFLSSPLSLSPFPQWPFSALSCPTPPQRARPQHSWTQSLTHTHTLMHKLGCSTPLLNYFFAMWYVQTFFLQRRPEPQDAHAEDLCQLLQHLASFYQQLQGSWLSFTVDDLPSCIASIFSTVLL